MRASTMQIPHPEETAQAVSKDLLRGTGDETQTTSHVRIDVGGQVVTAAITNESVEDLKLAVGQTAYAVIKASDVTVGAD